MKILATIAAIYIAPRAGEPMMPATTAKILQSGIEGDRYTNYLGAYSNTRPEKIRHISLISQSGIALANENLTSNGQSPFTEIQTRRNIALSGISPSELNELVGCEFQLGEIILKGVELCTPCERPAHLSNKSNFVGAFEGLGGLRAEVIKTGILSLGDVLILNKR